MKNKSKVEELDATLVLMQKQSASDGVSDSEILEESEQHIDVSSLKCFKLFLHQVSVAAGSATASQVMPVERKVKVSYCFLSFLNMG